MKRPTKPAHYEEVSNQLDFLSAYSFLFTNGIQQYQTKVGTPFTTEAGVVKRGKKAGEKVILFKRNGQERARAYECCWGKTTNCNRTYIDSYTCIIDAHSSRL